MTREEKINDSFNVGLNLLADGSPVEFLEECIEQYKQTEQYEICAGYKRAIDWTMFWSLLETVKKKKITMRFKKSKK